MSRQMSSLSARSENQLAVRSRGSRGSEASEQGVAPLRPELPAVAPPRALPNRLSLRSNPTYSREVDLGSKSEEHGHQNSYLSGDSHAEERAVQRIHSGTASKALRFDEAKDFQMKVPDSGSLAEEDTPEKSKGTDGSPSSPKSPSPRLYTDQSDMFQPRSCWHLDLVNMSFMRRKSNLTMNSRSGFSLTSAESIHEIRVALTVKQHKDFLVIHPHATFKICWDMMGMLFLLRDIFFIPLQLFDVPAAYLMQWLDTTSLIFWTLDIFLSFFTGYYQKGRLELKHRKIACNYVKTWFFLDVLVVGIDWWFSVQPTNGAEGVARVTKSIRSARFLRMFRLIRLSKMSKVSILMREQISSEAGIIYFGILLVILRMFVLQHVIACGWFGIGELATEEENRSWILTHGFRERTFQYQYSTCLHWAFAQLGMGSVEIEAETTQERIFCIGVAFVGLISFSTLVSTVTSLMSNLQKAQDQEQQLFRDLRRFLHQNDIPIDLSQRVTRFLQHAYRLQTSRSVDSEVAIFQLLSKSLNAELQFTRYKNCLYSLALCRKILSSGAAVEAETVAQKLAVRTLSTVPLAQNDFVFQRGTVAHTCYFALENNLEYVRERGNRKSVEEGTLISELALWTPWVHVGGLVTKEMNRVVAIDVESFCACVAEIHEVQEQAIYLAQHIVEAMNDESQDLTDLWQYHVEDASELSHKISATGDPFSPLMRFWHSCAGFARARMGPKEVHVVPAGSGPG